MREETRRCRYPSVLSLIILLAKSSSIHAFSSSGWLGNTKLCSKPVVVVGKIILDEYGNPNDAIATDDSDVTVGGGGPQAAWGAAAALAVIAGTHSKLPPRQPVHFIGAVGEDWTSHLDESLKSLLGPLCESVCLVRAPEMRTPRIKIWHDEEELVQWEALNESFGPQGADGLWRNRPSASDILTLIDRTSGSSSFNLHMILEAGANAPGEGMDAAPLNDPQLKERVNFLSVEPVVFLDDATGEVSPEDAESCSRILERISANLDFVCPDEHLHRALDPIIWQRDGRKVAVRDGARGSVIFFPDEFLGDVLSVNVPAAKLLTPNGQPVNPTGAGNAYSAAAAACLGAGLSMVDTACIATSVGAVVCEHDHLPPWSSDVLARIGQAAEEVQGLVLKKQPAEHLSI